ncbi:MAG TPA: hypothetical protein VF610_09960 [Segetibacter sp.]|jgi:hypothetical protein
MSYNIFNTVHRPLKLALLTTCLHLSNKKRFHLKEAVNSTYKINEVLHIFKEQIEYENDVILPLVFEYEPAIANQYLEQHNEQMDQMHELQRRLKSFGDTESELQQFETLTAVSKVFDAFLLSNYHHMDDEEETLNQVLSCYYSKSFLMELPLTNILRGLNRNYGQTKIIHAASAA